jgi:uncharacterized protein (TIGR03086 family)
MEMLDALSETFDHATKVLGGVQPAQLSAPTPCREWDVRALVGHMMGVVVNMGRGASGAELVDFGSITLADDLGTQFRTEADRTLAAWKARGAGGEVNIGAGPMPVAAAMGINLIDTATHSWDVARATGQDGRLPDELAAVVLAAAQASVSDQVRAFAGIDPAVPAPAGAGATEQLVAFLVCQP